jgi:hypothetical protein
MYAAMGLARKSTSAATSSVLPRRFIGMCFAIPVTSSAGIVFQAAALDDPRRHAIDAHAFERPFHGQRLGQVANARPGSAGMRHARQSPKVIDHDIDHNALVLRKEKPLGHGLGHVPGAIQVGIDDCLPAL